MPNIQDLSESVPLRLRGLDLERRREFETRFNREARSEDTMAVLVWCLGFLGGHRFYLGQGRAGTIFLLAFTLGALLVLFASASGNVPLFAFGMVIWLLDAVAVIVDIVRHARLTKAANLAIKDRVLRELELHGHR